MPSDMTIGDTIPRDVRSALRSSTSLRSWLLPLINLMERRFWYKITAEDRQAFAPRAVAWYMTSGNDRSFPFANPFPEVTDAPA